MASLTYLDEPLPSVNLHELSAFTRENYGGYWHFGFNHTSGLAELLLQGHEREFFNFLYGQMLYDPSAITEADKDEYLRTFATPAGISGSNGWYRDLLTTTDQFAEAIAKGSWRCRYWVWGARRGRLSPRTSSR